jgi:hypothetical protein
VCLSAVLAEELLTRGQNDKVCVLVFTGHKPFLIRSTESMPTSQSPSGLESLELLP